MAATQRLQGVGRALIAALAVGAALLGAAASRTVRPSHPGAGAARECRPPAGSADLRHAGMAWIPSGSFTMGSDESYDDERPLRPTTVAGFWIDVHEVTNADFRAFVAETSYVTSAERAAEFGLPEAGSVVFSGSVWAFQPGADWRHPEGPGSGIDGRDADPVVQVSLQDAQAYAAWKGRRLPTEAQWEYAARGGLDGARYAWGDEPTPGGVHHANTWQGQFPVSDTGTDGYAGRAPVGCFPPNGYGLSDMIGNVWEWTADPYVPDPSLADAHPRGFDPRQPGVTVGVIKGGSFLCSPDGCARYRPSARHPQERTLATNHLGFRTVALD